MPVCVEDAESLAELHAECWLDEGIVVLDETLTKQELIDLATARLGHILLIDTEVRRHELVIDNKTGQALAYARWTLPESCAKRWDLRRIPYIEPWERREYKEQHDKTSLPFDTPPELEAPRIATAEADPEYDNVRLSARQRAARRSKQDPKRHAGGNPVRELEEMHMPDRAYEHYISEISPKFAIGLIELGIISTLLTCSRARLLSHSARPRPRLRSGHAEDRPVVHPAGQLDPSAYLLRHHRQEDIRHIQGSWLQ